MTLQLTESEARASLIGAGASLAEGWVDDALRTFADGIDMLHHRAGGPVLGYPVSDRNKRGAERLVAGGEESRVQRAELFRAIADAIDPGEYGPDATTPTQRDVEQSFSDHLADGLALGAVMELLAFAAREIEAR